MWNNILLFRDMLLYLEMDTSTCEGDVGQLYEVQKVR